MDARRAQVPINLVTQNYLLCFDLFGLFSSFDSNQQFEQVKQWRRGADHFKNKKSMKLALNDSLRVELKILTYLYERQRLPITIKGCLKIDPCQDYFIFKGGEGGVHRFRTYS